MTVPATFLIVSELGARARVEAARAASERPHRFVDERCVRCQMRASWEGARYACAGTYYSERAAKCGAPTWKGHPCPRAVIAGLDRCSFHRGVR